MNVADLALFEPDKLADMLWFWRTVCSLPDGVVPARWLDGYVDDEPRTEGWARNIFGWN